MNPLFTVRKHWEREVEYPLSLVEWLESIGDALDDYEVTEPAGLSVEHESVDDVVRLVFSSGTAGKFYDVQVKARALNGDTQTFTLRVRVFGEGQTEVADSSVVTLITGDEAAEGDGIVRTGAKWSYQLAVVADEAGASAEFRIRIGHTPDCPIDFGPPGYTVTVTVDPTPDDDGKYRGAAAELGTNAWPYHAADIVDISGAGAVGTVTGSQT